MKIGLCGRSGSGKGWVSAMFAENGIPSIDTDAVYREMTSPSDEASECMKALIGRFGDCVANPDNSLNRAEMRKIAFGGDSAALADLNSITHRFILEKTDEYAGKYYESGSKIVLIDAPLLFESGFDRFCTRTICVTASEETLVRRIVRRDGLTPEAAKARLAVQKSRAELEERCDYVLENNGDDETLKKRVKAVSDELYALYEAEK